ncbi:MAG TPA: hypothetical protein VGP69_00775 [Gaiellaceae bacterium]|nr:hypothetical protein [Gaiellaceae bacterium]
MPDAVPVRIQYVGPDDPNQPRFPPSRTEIIRTARVWKKGDEMLPTHPGLYVWDVDFHRGGNVYATYVVRVVPPAPG